MLVAGPHLTTYEDFFRQADPRGSGSIGALEAANFLKKSALNDVTLSQIWELSDPNGKGFLDKDGFFTALKLIALAQCGKDVAMVNIQAQAPAPNMSGGLNSPGQAGIADGEWAIPQSEINKYDQIFEGLHPVNNLLAGDKVRPVLLNSKLPVDVLGRVWDLSDIDGDGFLDREEFAIAMHLVYRALEKDPVPEKLPPNLIPPSKRRKGSVLAGAVPVLPGPAPVLPSAPAIPGPPGVALGGRNSPATASPARRASGSSSGVTTWVITPAEQDKYDEMFKAADLDKDGFVNGIEIKDLFIQSGVPQQVLAHIWNLCDTRGLGKLNTEQFALAMYLIQQKLKGIEPPQTLPPDMMPPSMRQSEMGGFANFGAEPSSTSKELDEITKEIEDLKKEKMQLEVDKAQKEADIQIRNGEVAALQKEQDALNLTVSQLENQKAEAQKRLDELDDKRTQLVTQVTELRAKCDEEQKSIENLRSQLINQEFSVKSKEEEVKKMREELSDLRGEESELEDKVEASRKKLDEIKRNFTETSSIILQTKQKLERLAESEKAIQQGIEQFGSLLAGDTNTQEPPSLESLTSSDDLVSNKATVGSNSVGSLGGFSFDSNNDPFKDKDPFTGANGEADPFGNDDPFKGSDPFKQEGFGASDPFSGSDPFTEGGDSYKQSQAPASWGIKPTDDWGDDPYVKRQQEAVDSFRTDPFKHGDDSFEAAFSAAKTKKVANDPFDPFGGEGGGGSRVPDLTSPDMSFGTDPFGADPFNPTNKKKGSSPIPALPPKQKKAPPPRPPAPVSPNPMSGPKISSTKSKPAPNPDPFGGSDAFGGGTMNNEPFGGFADFSPSKFSSTPPTTTKTTYPNTDDDMAVALRESQKFEAERRRRQEQEQADLELAIALSKQDMGSSEA